MRNLLLCGLIAAAGPLAAAPIHHDFLAIDEGLSDLMRVNESNPKENWLVHIDREHPRDMQLEGQGKLLISHDHGYCEYDIKTGNRVKDVSSYHDVSSVRRLGNGHLLIAGVDFDAQKLNKGDAPIGDPNGRHVVFAEYDENGQQVKRTTYTGDYLRLVRETAAGTFLCGCNTMFKEADGKGNWIREFPVKGFQHAWMALRLANGNTLMSAGYGTSNPPNPNGTSFMAEDDPSGKLLRTFGAKTQVPAAIHPYFYAMFQPLANGDVVIANWQGHKAGHNYSGEQVVELDSAGNVAWTWSDRAFVSSIQGVLVIDGQDLNRISDERNGVMAPID